MLNERLEHSIFNREFEIRTSIEHFQKRDSLTI